MKLQDFDFRIWDKHHKGCGNKDCKCQTKYVYGEEAKIRLSEFKEDCEIELFIGLCDTNGKKIYEGDIAKIITFSYDFVGHVAYDKEETRFKLIDNKYMEDFANYEDWDSIEVIGNIHENKELLRI
ncbi:YopX family protein [Campylobacter jejuni]|nr:YopX family protein [Campylobacter jejuni]